MTRTTPTAELAEVQHGVSSWRFAIYLCRWPNGDFSIVAAENRSDAVFQLDEWGAARLDPLTVPATLQRDADPTVP